MRLPRASRVTQWATFSRRWLLYDAQWQNPFQSAKVITKALEGKNKPIYHPYNDAGDHVIVTNAKDVALLGREWQLRVYFHHEGPPRAYGGGAKWVPAWQMHQRDPTIILWKACYNNLFGDLMRKGRMARLHVFPDEDVPEELLANVSGQLSQVRPVPKGLEQFTEEERKKFPSLWDYPDEYALK